MHFLMVTAYVQVEKDKEIQSIPYYRFIQLEHVIEFSINQDKKAGSLHLIDGSTVFLNEKEVMELLMLLGKGQVASSSMPKFKNEE